MMLVPKKSKEIYNVKIAHRGCHKNHGENTLEAFKEAMENDFAIETDIRITKDGVLVCYHDRYLKRLLGSKGKISEYTYSEILNMDIKDTKEKVPTLKQLLDLVDGKVVLLLEIKGNINKRLKMELCKQLNTYNGKVYFHTKNIFTYFYIKRIFGNKVFFVLDPIRKRFDFIKLHKKDYKM